MSMLFVMGACTRTTEKDTEPWKAGQGFVVPSKVPDSDENPYISDPRSPNQPIISPTPDAPHPIPGARTEAENYVVQPGDTLGVIANRYGVTLDAIAEASNLSNINILSVGQELVIPPPDPIETGPSFKIIPNSELIASPVTVYFDTADFAFNHGGYLIRYEEEVDEQLLNGVQIVQLIAQDFSVNPRLLLAILEYQSGWVTNTNPPSETIKYPLGWKDPNREGLYRQLSWAANQLNLGYYMWRVSGVPTWILEDGTVVPINPTINAGTAAVQHFFAKLYGVKFWEKTVSEEGFFTVYTELFGYPFDYALEPVLPPDLTQPPILSQEDLACILGVSLKSIKRIFACYREQGEALPSRGEIWDMGRGVSHKVPVIRKYVQGCSFSRISLDLGKHGVGSMSRYLRHFALVMILEERGLTPSQMHSVIGISENLIQQYLALYFELRVPEYARTLERLKQVVFPSRHLDGGRSAAEILPGGGAEKGGPS